MPGLGSTSAEKRALLDALCSNRVSGDVSLVLEKRSPFSLLAEGRDLTNGRDRCQEIQPTEVVNAVMNPFLGPPEPYLLRLPALLGAA